VGVPYRDVDASPTGVAWWRHDLVGAPEVVRGACGRRSRRESALAGMHAAGTPRGALRPQAPPGTSSWPACSARLAWRASLRARYCGLRSAVAYLAASSTSKPSGILAA